MTGAVPLRVERLDGGRVRLVQGAWSHVCAVGDLPGWHGLYARLAARGGKAGGHGPWAGFYAENRDVLAREVRR